VSQATTRFMVIRLVVLGRTSRHHGTIMVYKWLGTFEYGNIDRSSVLFLKEARGDGPMAGKTSTLREDA